MPAALTQPEYLARVKRVNPNIEVVGTYVHALTPIKARCTDCGTEFERLAHLNYQSRKGTGCPRCSKVRHGIRQGNEADFIDALLRAGSPFTPLEPYTGMNRIMRARCRACGSTVRRSARHHIDHACPVCVDKARDKRTRDDKMAELVALGGGCCQWCGYSTHHDALDHHHVNKADKNFHVCKAEFWRPWEEVVAEARKCVLCCASCHRMVHHRPAETYQNKRNRDQKRHLIHRRGETCWICQGMPPDPCLDFHHIDPATKSFTLTNRIGHHPLPLLEKEADKCALLDANCHREYHAGIHTLSFLPCDA